MIAQRSRSYVTSPWQELPAPAVHAKQWSPVTICRRESLSMSKPRYGPGPVVGGESEHLVKLQSYNLPSHATERWSGNHAGERSGIQSPDQDRHISA